MEGEWGCQLPGPDNAWLISGEKLNLRILFGWTCSMKKSHPRKVIQGTTSSAFPTGLVLCTHAFPHICSKITTLGPLQWLGTVSASGLLQKHLPLAGTHLPILLPHLTPPTHTDNISDQQAGGREFSQFPSPLHSNIFPSKFAVPSTTKSFCGPAWLALASEMWTKMAMDKFRAYTKGQHIFCLLLLLRTLPHHSSGSRRMKHSHSAGQQSWKSDNADCRYGLSLSLLPCYL